MGGHLVIGPTRTVVRPGADCKFGLCSPQLSFELGKSVHVKKFSTEKLFLQNHSGCCTGINHDPTVLMDFNQLGVQQVADVPGVLAINQVSA